MRPSKAPPALPLWPEQVWHVCARRVALRPLGLRIGAGLGVPEMQFPPLSHGATAPAVSLGRRRVAYVLGAMRVGRRPKWVPEKRLRDKVRAVVVLCRRS